MAIEILGWAKALLEVVSQLTGLLKRDPATRRREIAQRLAALHHKIDRVVCNGNAILASLSSLDTYPVDRGMVSYLFLEEPLSRIEPVRARPTSEQLSALINLVSDQETLLLEVIELLREKEFRNLGVLVENLPLLEVTLINKFGYVSILLSSLYRRRTSQAAQTPKESGLSLRHHESVAGGRDQEEEGLHSGAPGPVKAYLEKVDFRIPAGTSFFDRFEGNRYEVIFGRKEVSDARSRLTQLECSNSELREAIRSSFKPEEYL